MVINKIVINKIKNKGIANVELSAILEENTFTLNLNQFQVDLSNGSEPVKVLQADSIPVFSGELIDALKEKVLEIFEVLKDEGLEIGIFEYELDNEGNELLNKVGE